MYEAFLVVLTLFAMPDGEAVATTKSFPMQTWDACLAEQAQINKQHNRNDNLWVTAKCYMNPHQMAEPSAKP